MHLEFLIDVTQVIANAVDREIHQVGDFGVGFPFSQQGEHSSLLPGEGICRLGMFSGWLLKSGDDLAGDIGGHRRTAGVGVTDSPD